MNINEKLIGKRIIKATVDGFGVVLDFDDGTTFGFDASDGGCSDFDLYQTDEI